MDSDDESPDTLDRVSAARERAGCLQAVLVAGLVVLGGLLLSAAVLGIGIYRAGDQFAQRLGGLFAPPPQPTAALSTQSVIVRQLRDAAELTTDISTVDTIVDESQERRLGSLTIGTTRLLYVAHGQVRAGVDLGELAPDDVRVTEDTVTVILPPPRLLDRKIDVERSYVYDLDRSLLGPVDPDLQSRAERFALDKVVRAACEAGVLEQANDRAALVVREILEAAGIENAVVETQPPPPGACPPPPTPAPPVEP
jgi:hypothetical protein